MEESIENNSNLSIYYDFGKYGYCNKDKKIIIPCIYDKATDFSNGSAIVAIGKKYFLIDEIGQKITKEYDTIRNLNTSILIAGRDKIKRLIDNEGNYINDIEYTFVSSRFLEGLSIVKRIISGRELLGFINEVGVEVIPCRFDGQTPGFYDGLARISNSYGKWSYINKAGIEITAYIFDDLYWITDKGHQYNEQIEGVFFDNFRIVKLNRKFGCINRTGQIVIPCNYDVIKKIQDGVIIVGNTINGASFFLKFKYGLLNYEGKTLIELQYDTVELHKSFIRVYFGSKWDQRKKVGLFSLSGTLILPCCYNDIYVMVVPYIVAQKNNECILLNLTNNTTSILDFDKMETKDNNIYSFEKEGKIGWMLSNFIKITEPIYDLDYNFIKYPLLRLRKQKANSYFVEGFQKVKRENKFGFIDVEGNEVIKCIYDKVDDFFCNGYANVVLNGAQGNVDSSGNFSSV